MKLSTFRLLLLIELAISSTSLLNAQAPYFTSVALESREKPLPITEHLKKYALYQINIEDLRAHLLPAPLDVTKRSNTGILLDIPMPDGSVETFMMYEDPLLAPEVAKKHPEIKTYTGYGIKHKSYTIKINFTIRGLSAVIVGLQKGEVFFEKQNNTETPVYVSYYSDEVIYTENKGTSKYHSRCGTMEHEKQDGNIEPREKPKQRLSESFTNGTNLRTIRLAMAADAEFTANRGGTKALAFAALTDYVNTLDAVYKYELSVKFTLVSGDNIVYTDPNTDPYANSDQVMMLDENQTNLDNVIGNSNYDVGHVLGYAGSSGGGIASSPSVCESAYKGQGVSGVRDANDNNWPIVFDNQLIAHEVGHQFSMSHSYNSNIPVCTTREYNTSVEPGAGTTIMSYGFTCDGDDYERPPYEPFLNFHVVSINQALTYLSNNPTCGTSSSTGNNIPVITVPGTSYTIPKSTPFSLSGTATDADGDDLSYSWEGTNISNEPDNNNLTTNTIYETDKPPFFRSYKPLLASQNSQPGLRVFPRLEGILNGTNTAKGDKLPSIAITTTHTLSVRDNYGGLATQDVTVTIDGTSGPFVITGDPSGTHNGNSSLTVTWDVSNTDNATINCTLVDIFLSTDGGHTFPTELKHATANDGSESVTLPNINTSTARIKVAPSTPNIFFDISNQDFIISEVLPVNLLSFEANLDKNQNVLLRWTTSNEVANKGFEVQISSDGTTFAAIDFVKRNENAASIKNYTYSVDRLSPGTYYFRLKQIDFSGSYTYSEIRTLTIKSHLNDPTLYPNPTKEKLMLNPGTFNENLCKIEIADIAGNKVLSLPSKMYSDGSEINISSLPNGTYFLKISNGKEDYLMNFIKY